MFTPEAPPIAYPPKFPLAPTESKPLLIKGLYSAVIYIGLGYLLIQRWDLLLTLVGVIILHEAGHFIAMKYYNYSDVSVLFIPLIGALVKGSKKEISQQQSAVILLAGPLPGIIIGIIIHLLIDDDNTIYLGNISLQLIAQLLIWTNFLNLLPIYPLDGGQLINRVFFNEEGRWSTVFILLSAAFVVWFSVNIQFYLLLIFPVLLIYKHFANRKFNKLDKEIDSSGIDIDKDYEDLSNEDYWKLRKLVIRHTTGFQHIQSDIYKYDDKEDKIAIEVDNALQRTLLMDISVMQKIVVLFIWLLFISLPWLLNIDFSLIKYLSR